MHLRKHANALITADKKPALNNNKKRDTAPVSSSTLTSTPLRSDEAYTRHLAAIIESSEDAIISKSLEGIITTWNKGGEKMFGFTVEEAVGQHISIIIPQEYASEEKNIIEKIRNNEIIDHYETVRSKKNGEQFYVSLTVSALRDSSGTIVGISKIARDITARKNAEAALILSKELIFKNEEKRAAELIIANKELAFQNAEKERKAAELIIANNELVFENEEKEKRAAELVIANNELVFQNREKEKRAAELLIANNELAFQNNEKEKRAAELNIANEELALQNARKEKRAAELVIANTELAFQNDRKQKLAAELTIANIELAFQNEEKEKRAAELINANNELNISKEQVIEVNKELESFSYSVSHDLRAPLRAVNGYAKMLKSNFENQLDPEAHRLVNNIVNNAKKMGQLIDDLLTFSRIGRRELVKTNVRMEDVVTGICDELKSEERHRHIEFRIKKIFPAQADNMAIKQVWLNLVSNAIKYTRLKDAAIIEISSELEGDEITYHIKDNGAGFDMRYAGKLFGVFQRLHSDEEFEGTGVGLALVQRIIAKHGGRIWAQGEVDKGATFSFTLHTS